MRRIDERSTQLPSRTGKVRQEWQPAAKDKGNCSGARKQEGGEPSAKYEDRDEDDEDRRQQQAPEVPIRFLLRSGRVRKARRYGPP